MSEISCIHGTLDHSDGPEPRGRNAPRAPEGEKPAGARGDEENGLPRE
jgi:hypothetical protein